MTGCFVNHAIRLVVALALLVTMMTSPIRRSDRPGPSRRPDDFLRQSEIAGSIAHHRANVTARSSVSRARDVHADGEVELDADVEDELNVASPPARTSFDVLPAPSRGPSGEVVGSAVLTATCPLRC